MNSDTEPASDEILHSFLRDRDVPCPLCGYNLRNLTGGRCPECGNDLVLRVGVTEPRLGAFLVLLVACCTGFGGSLLFSLIALSAAPRNWWEKPAALVLLAQLLLTGVLLPVIVKKRPRFRRLSVSTQKTLAAIMCMLVGMHWACVIALFRE